MAVSLEDITALVRRIQDMSKSLPQTVPESTKEGKLYEVMTTMNGDSHWETFNRRFDNLFGEHCRDKNGRLYHLRRGKYGL